MTDERVPAGLAVPFQPPLFISFEGTEGSGKSTQAAILVERMRANGFIVTQNQEPGTTSIGKQIRAILLDPVNSEITGMTELLMMFAARTQAAAQVILPALNRGEIVITDRFTDSTMAYQGYARGLGFELVRNVHRLSLGSLLPDLTLYIAIDLETGLARARARNAEKEAADHEGRIDAQSLEFHKRVQEGYRRIAGEEPERFRIVDGSGAPPAVARRVWETVMAAVLHESS
jgi:dTMP kinase